MSNPLFLTDVAEMQAELRLSGVPDGDAALAALNTALLEVRTGFYRRLGIERVGQLVDMDEETDAPESNEELLRALARTTEIKWTFVTLMDRLPMLFMDDSGGAWQQFNEQGTFRKLGLKEREEMRKRLLDEIKQNLEVLAGEQELGNETTVQGGAYGDEHCPHPKPGDTIFPPNGRDSSFPIL